MLRAFSILLRVPFDACRSYPALLDAIRRIPTEQLGLYVPEMAARGRNSSRACLRIAAF